MLWSRRPFKYSAHGWVIIVQKKYITVSTIYAGYMINHAHLYLFFTCWTQWTPLQQGYPWSVCAHVPGHHRRCETGLVNPSWRISVPAQAALVCPWWGPTRSSSWRVHVSPRHQGKVLHPGCCISQASPELTSYLPCARYAALLHSCISRVLLPVRSKVVSLWV